MRLFVEDFQISTLNTNFDMLIEFAATNYRSIRERQSLSLRASGQINPKDHPDHLLQPSDKSHGGALIRAGVLYGANASGKSNILKGLNALSEMVKGSDQFKLDKNIPFYDPFRLDLESRSLPTVFEIDFIAKDGHRYRYLVEFDQKTILREELSFFPIGGRISRAKNLFRRVIGASIDFGEDYRGKRSFTILDNQLLLSRAGLESLPSLTEAYRFFSTHLFCLATYLDSFENSIVNKVSKDILSDSEYKQYKEAIVSLVKAADTGISDVFVEETSDPLLNFTGRLPSKIKREIVDRFQRKIKTIHPILQDGETIDEAIFDLEDESTGTVKFLGVVTYVVDAIYDGSIVVVDELDKHLHPLLTRMLINLFHSSDTNPHNAQLIFSSHDVSLIDRELFRRDQIYLVDKGIDGASTIGRLSAFTGISKVAPLMKWYMAGMFNAVPATNSSQIQFNFEETSEHA